MIRQSCNASLNRPRHRSRPAPERLEDRLQPNSLIGLWDDLALGLPTIARPRPTADVAQARESHDRGARPFRIRRPRARPARPIPALAPGFTTVPGSQSAIPISAVPTAISSTQDLSQGIRQARSLAQGPLFQSPAAPTAQPAQAPKRASPPRTGAALTPCASTRVGRAPEPRHGDGGPRLDAKPADSDADPDTAHGGVDTVRRRERRLLADPMGALWQWRHCDGHVDRSQLDHAEDRDRWLGDRQLKQQQRLRGRSLQHRRDVRHQLRERRRRIERLAE